MPKLCSLCPGLVWGIRLISAWAGYRAALVRPCQDLESSASRHLDHHLGLESLSPWLCVWMFNLLAETSFHIPSIWAPLFGVGPQEKSSGNNISSVSVQSGLGGFWKHDPLSSSEIKAYVFTGSRFLGLLFWGSCSLSLSQNWPQNWPQNWQPSGAVVDSQLNQLAQTRHFCNSLIHWPFPGAALRSIMDGMSLSQSPLRWPQSLVHAILGAIWEKWTRMGFGVPMKNIPPEFFVF